jgi:hypothetical protein
MVYTKIYKNSGGTDSFIVYIDRKDRDYVVKVRNLNITGLTVELTFQYLGISKTLTFNLSGPGDEEEQDIEAEIIGEKAHLTANISHGYHGVKRKGRIQETNVFTDETTTIQYFN